MPINNETTKEIKQTISGRTIVPFTGGIIVFVYAWFWPDGYGRWLGTIVHGFRAAAGFGGG